MNKLWSIQPMGCHPALRRNELASHKKTWRNLRAPGQVGGATLEGYVRGVHSATFWKRHRCGAVGCQWSPGVGVRGRVGGAWIFRAGKGPDDTAETGTCHRAFFPTQGTRDSPGEPRGEPCCLGDCDVSVWVHLG